MRSPLPHRQVLLFVLAGGAVAFALAVLAVVANGAAREEDPVLVWNRALLDAVRSETTPPPLAARNLAVLHEALERAIERDAGGLRLDVVLTAAASEVATALCPGRVGEFAALRDRLFALAPAPTAREWLAGRDAAAEALAARIADGSSRSVTYIPRTEPGQWRRTAPYFRPPEMPQWVEVRTFLVDLRGVEERLPGPPPLDSDRWRTALDEVRRLGGRDSSARGEEQALIARFWSDFTYTSTPPGRWNEIAATLARERGLGPEETARLFAVLNVALADAGIACWKVKYARNFWRPVTALGREGWQPYLNTPPHPEYPSGHSVFSGAAAEVLAAFFGDAPGPFSVRSDSVPGVVRTFTSLAAVARESSESRIYGGIHFRFSCEDGLVLGRAVAREVLTRSRLSPDPAVAAK